MLCNGCGKSVGGVSRLCEDCASVAATQARTPVQADTYHGAASAQGPVELQEIFTRPSVQIAALFFVSLCLFAYNLMIVGDRLGLTSLGLLFLGNTFALIGGLSFFLLWFGMVIEDPASALLFFISPRALRIYVWNNWSNVKVTASVGIACGVLALVTTFAGFTHVPPQEMDLFMERSYVAYYMGYANTSDEYEAQYYEEDY